MMVRFTEQEKAAVAEVSARLGMSPGAWVSEMAVRYARGQLSPIPADWRDVIGELVRSRAEVQQVYTMVRQVARHANATGEFESETERLVTLADRLLSRIDALTEQANERERRSR